MKKLIALCFAVFAFSSLSYADDISETTDLTADQFAAEARSLLSLCVAEGNCPSISLAERAEEMCVDALELDPSHIEGRVQMAIALSLQARELSNGEARKGKYAERMRGYAETVLEDDPDNEWAHGFLAVWNLEVMRRGGMVGAAVMGASYKNAEKHFERLNAIAPDNLVLKWQYARALAALNPRKYEDEIIPLFQLVAGATTNDPLERAVQGRAAGLLVQLEAREYSDVKDEANATL